MALRTAAASIDILKLAMARLSVAASIAARASFKCVAAVPLAALASLRKAFFTVAKGNFVANVTLYKAEAALSSA